MCVVSLGDLLIRTATASDAEAISKTVIQSLRETNAADYAPEVIDAVAANFSPAEVKSRFADRITLVATLSGRVVGTASLQGRTARTVFVDPGHQARGIGTALMQALEHLAVAQGTVVLTVPSSITAESFYRKLGFVALRDEHHGSERTVVMEKHLTVRANHGGTATVGGHKVRDDGASEFFDEAAVARAWDANAERWTEDVRAGFDRHRELYTFPAFLAFMPEIAGRTVIDLGCGEGANTRQFARRGARMTGVDLSPAMIAHAREAEREEPLGIRYEVASFTDLTLFERDSFDGALSTMALMDGPNFPAATRAVARVLRPGGFLCFSVLHPCFVTPVAAWLKSEDGEGYAGLREGRYFETEPFQGRWRFSKRPAPETVEPFTVPRFPRTLSDYLNAVVDAGLMIERLDEPRPDVATAAAHPWLQRWRDHAPMVLFVSARKHDAPKASDLGATVAIRTRRARR